MRFWAFFFGMILSPIILAGALFAQSASDEQAALRAAKSRAAAAEARSENLRQEASNAGQAADRVVAQRAVLASEIDAAAAQIAAANARIAIINRRQMAQRNLLGEASEPMLRLNAALQQMTGKPTALMLAQPGQREDYIHLRAVMATVEPSIKRRTAALRQQIALQRELRAQEFVALKSLNDARGRLAARRNSLAQLEGSSRERADSLSANAAVEFEQAIAQGEAARDIVDRIDTMRMSGETASMLTALDGPLMRQVAPSPVKGAQSGVYILPEHLALLSGYNELNETGYRERGLTLQVGPGADVIAPAAGKIIFAGIYRSFGHIVIIEHGAGWTSLITNLAAVSVDKGDRVGQGDTLGSASDTAENADADSAPYIGIELRRNGRPMDIAAMLD
jgi:murein hydrolase activator